ncbi:MAG TPA: DUF2339 domain-containing protein, partial [Flavisolibacter sp.]|nr:DUF2339 domain-containing protein [Flavisolibacter sp.]
MMDKQAQIQKLEEEMKQLSAQLSAQHRQLLELRRQLHELNPNAQSTAKKEPAFSLEALRSSSLENLIGLRLIHLIGIVVLVIGLSLGVKYAIDKNLISEELRIALAYAAGVVLYALSLWLRKSLPGFSAILFSGGMASLYFTTYGACVYYHFFSITTAFAVMIALTIYTTYEALRYNRQEIALLGLVGAYGIPFLVSPNRGQAELLFLYMTIINAGVLFLSVKKPWLLVGRFAQAISWLIFIGWASLQNDVGLKSYGLIYMLLFFFLFFANAVAGKLFRKEPLNTGHTYQLLTNNIAFYLAALFVFGYSFVNSTVALISLLFAGFAGLQALFFYWWKEKEATRLLAYDALLLFVIFIGFQWKGITVTLLWLLTAVIIFISGVRLKVIPARMAAIALMGFTLFK